MKKIERIKNSVMHDGISLFGTGFIGDKVNFDLKRYQYAISMGINYPKFIIHQLKSGPIPIYFHQYRAMNALLDSCAMKVQSLIMQSGYQALYVPASQSDPNNKYNGLFSHKIAAVRSGLGFIGKNNLFISDQYGAALRLSTILTDMPLKAHKEVENKCKSCTLCFDACPSGAIFGSISESKERYEMFDPQKCSEYMKNAYQHIGRGVVCGICIGVCPFSK